MVFNLDIFICELGNLFCFVWEGIIEFRLYSNVIGDFFEDFMFGFMDSEVIFLCTQCKIFEIFFLVYFGIYYFYIMEICCVVLRLFECFFGII